MSDYLKKFQGGLIPIFDFDREDLQWRKAFSARVKIKELPFKKEKKYFKWEVKVEPVNIKHFKLISIISSNHGYLELFVFKDVIYENINYFPKNIEADYFFEFYEQLQIISKRFDIVDYYCGEVKNKEGLYKIYNETFQWWDGEIWSDNIDHYRFLCKTISK